MSLMTLKTTPALVLVIVTVSPCFGQATAKSGQTQGSQTQAQPSQSPANAPRPKDRAVVEDLQTGQRYEVKVPSNAAKVKQTGPNTYDVKVNSKATKKIEVKPIPPKR